LAGQFFRKWLQKCLHTTDTCKTNAGYETDFETKPVALDYKFSPMTYENPYIYYMQPILKCILKQKQIPYQRLELVVIDADQGRSDDMDDIRIVLEDLAQGLNYLLLITDEPDSYKHFAEEMYQENGLLVQQVPKSAKKESRGNFIIDFERNGKILSECIHAKTTYLPIYKKPWEISENLDIIVPVGYNTLVVSGISLPAESRDSFKYERFMNDKIDRLDREFRKG